MPRTILGTQCAKYAKFVDLKQDLIMYLIWGKSCINIQLEIVLYGLWN